MLANHAPQRNGVAAPKSDVSGLLRRSQRLLRTESLRAGGVLLPDGVRFGAPVAALGTASA